MKKVIIASITASLLLLACGEEQITGPQEPDRLLPGTPVEVLKNNELAFTNCDSNLLNGMLSPDFTFYFDARDVGQSPPGSRYVIPEYWSRPEFSTAVANMFKKAYSVYLNTIKWRVGQPGAEETEYKAEDLNTALLAMIDEATGYYGEGPCDFAFEKYTSKEGGKYWHLTEWRDDSGYDGTDSAVG